MNITVSIEKMECPFHLSHPTVKVTMEASEEDRGESMKELAALFYNMLGDRKAEEFQHELWLRTAKGRMEL